MGGLILFIGAIFAALFGLAIVMAYITLAVFLRLSLVVWRFFITLVWRGG